MSSFELIDHSDEVIDEMKKAMERALEKIGMVGEAYAKEKCPVGTVESTGIKGYIGGTLRNSISHAVDDNTAIIGTNVEYAPYVELGTSKMDAQPYLRPAIENHIKEYKDIAKGELKS